MIQILLNKNFTSDENISATASTLDYRNGYFLNHNTGRGGLTSQFNVQAFLSNPNNSIIVNGFYDYLQNNFTQAQILTIENDNQNLSNFLNYYYNTFVAGVPSSNAFFFNNSGITSTAQTFSDNLYFPNGTPANKNETKTIYSNSADSYYINVVLYEKYNLMDDSDIFLEPNINNGFQIQKEVVQLDGLILNGSPVYSRTVSLNPVPQQLIQGFVNLNSSDSPFNNYSDSGLDFGITKFSGQTVFQIDAEISGDVSVTESIHPIGSTDVLIGKSQTFTFKTINNLKSISSVTVDGNLVNYDRVNNLSKDIAGSYTFNSVQTNHNIIVNFV